MKRKTIAYIVAYIALAAMAASATIYYRMDDHDAAWPWLMVFIVATWIHGIVWGALYKAKGRLTWF